jgi:hypothetical protein
VVADTLHCQYSMCLNAVANALLEPSNDPEIAQNGIDLLYRLIPTYVNNLLSHQPSSLEFLFVFTLKALTGSDPLPKISAADFWVCLIQKASFTCSTNHLHRVLLLVSRTRNFPCKDL